MTPNGRNGYYPKKGTFEIRSEAHGPHWVAWLARTADAAPEYAILVVGQTRAEAEARARQWAEWRCQSSPSSDNPTPVVVTADGTAVAFPITWSIRPQ